MPCAVTVQSTGLDLGSATADVYISIFFAEWMFILVAHSQGERRHQTDFIKLGRSITGTTARHRLQRTRRHVTSWTLHQFTATENLRIVHWQAGPGLARVCSRSSWEFCAMLCAAPPISGIQRHTYLFNDNHRLNFHRQRQV